MRPSRTRRRTCRGLWNALVVGALTIPVLPVWAQTPSATGAPSTATNPIEKAREQYEQGQFSEAVDDLRTELASGRLTGSSAREARELIARCLVRQGNRPDAKEAFKALLHLDPTYRPVPGSLPPDEQEVYDQAHKEFMSEQIEAGERVPASIAFTYGTGSGENKDIAKITAAGGGEDKFDTKPEFGGSVRFPVNPRIALEIELQRFRATNVDAEPNFYEITALPLSVSGVYALVPRSRWRVNVFGGLGSLLAATSKIKLDVAGSDLQVSDQKNGFYAHAGMEGEYLVTRRLSINGRLLGRVATAKDLYQDFGDFEAFGTEKLKGKEIDFSGFGAHIGLRAYIGY